MRKLFIRLSIISAVLTAMVTSCEKQFVNDIPPERQQLAATAKDQLDLSRQNWNKYAAGLARFVSYEPVQKINIEAEKNAVVQQLLSGDAYIAYGNVQDPSTLSLVTIASLHKQSAAAVDTLTRYATSQVRTGDQLVNIQWEKGTLRFTSKCIVRNDSIVWDNLLTNVVMMDPEGKTVKESSNDNPAAKYYRQWYKEWRSWTVNWIWGSRRGEMGEEITVWPYSNGQVYNTDARSWAYINIGSYRSESRVLVNAGTYGKIQYAVGVATPAASVTFNNSNFKVEVHGIGSSRIENGTHSLTPYPL
ncbi:MAG: hypothetical protein INR73_00690 [Williamsia sp.]|nr:hypothetical protein [Williamsia sp.]